jgi:SOS-response transcriptional repressor LexA|tara:strand:+ start:217 stop:468 length:252 start_codon:yes stop_codon:yes gene_type:complete
MKGYERYTMTKQQLKVYQYIVEYVRKERLSPTYEEIRKECNIGSVSNTYVVVRELIRKNLMEKVGRPQDSRQLRPIIDSRWID